MNAKSGVTKIEALLLEIKKTLPQVFIKLTAPPGMVYDELRRFFVAPSTYLTSEVECRDIAVALQSRTDKPA